MHLNERWGFLFVYFKYFCMLHSIKKAKIKKKYFDVV